MPPDEQWRPKLTRIEDPIADDHWEYTTPEGQQRIARLTVGRPVPYARERLWYCPVLIEGYSQPRVKPIFGSGPVDSLMNAMTFVRTFFDANSGILPGVKPEGPRRSPAPRLGNKAAPKTKSRKTPAGKRQSRAKTPTPPSR